MIIYTATKEAFSNDVEKNTLVENLCQLLAQRHHKVAQAEVRAFSNSLQYMYMVMNDVDIPLDAGIAIEYIIPSTPKRVDFIITGFNHKEDKSAVVIELKQWDSVDVVSEKDSIVRTYVGKGLRELPHPSYQAWSYAQLIEDFNSKVQDLPVSLHPCAYLHNYIIKKNDPILCSNPELIEKSPLFASKDTENLREFIKKYIHKGDKKEIIFQIESGKIRPSKSLQDTLVSMLKGNDEFVMVDDQKVTYEKALLVAKQIPQHTSKQVMIVKGGPGTGKSVVAINLLVNLTKRGFVTHYITKNSAPRNVYKTKLKNSFKMNTVDNLFKSSDGYHLSTLNELDVAIVDEAHRLRAKSGMYQHLGENQVKEIIHASKFSVFFIDENQMVTTSDIGSISEIMKYVKYFGADLHFEELTSQFRCNGSNQYLQWLDSILEINSEPVYQLGLDFDFRVYDDPNDMVRDIQLKNLNNKARVLAGYCWEWPKQNRSDTQYKDIQLADHNFAMSWNLGNTTTYAIDPMSVNEVGCIHTTQGLEFDYVGIIIGNDLRYDGEHIVTDIFSRAKSDNSTKGLKSLYKSEPEKAKVIADSIIKNTYKTLMTRGQKGCYIYCTDKNLSEHIKNNIPMYSINDLLLSAAEPEIAYLTE